MTTVFRTARTCLLFLGLAFAGAAHAQPLGPSMVTRASLWTDIGSHFGGPEQYDAFALSPLFGGHFDPANYVRIQAMWGLGFVSVSPESGADSTSSFRPGNPYLSGKYTGGCRACGMRYELGLGVAFPVASIPSGAGDDDAGSLNYFYAFSMRGLWNLFLWAPDTLSIVIPARGEHDIGQNLFVASELGLIFAIPTKNTDDRDVEFSGQAALELGIRATPNLTVGGRLTGVWLFTYDYINDDLFQLAFEPYVRADFGRGFVQGRFTLNIDEPHGFAFDSGKVWAIHVGGGVQL